MSCNCCGNNKKNEEIQELYDFMKRNYVLRAKRGDLELRLHPVAFSTSVPEMAEQPKEEIDYDKFVYPKKEDMEGLGL